MDKVNIYIPPSILYLCNGLQQKFTDLEFSILVKGKWTEDGFELSEETAIPKQEVTGASVDLNDAQTDKFKQEGFNTIIHSHPFKSTSFSHSDLQTLTPHYTCSILYSKGEFPVATISIDVHPGVKITVGTALFLLEYVSDLPENIGELIKRKYSGVVHYNPNYGGSYTYGANKAGKAEYDSEKCRLCADYAAGDLNNCAACTKDEESFQSGITTPEKPSDASNQMNFNGYG
jgi:proteasome lid subunit RPN8/RPN11